MFSIKHLCTNEGLLKSVNTYAKQDCILTTICTSQDKCGVYAILSLPDLTTRGEKHYNIQRNDEN